MNAAKFRENLEHDLAWRQNEMRILRNQMNYIKNDTDKKVYCKSLVVMLYSHFESFCKESFLSYIDAINDEDIHLSEANEYIAAASLGDLFLAINDPNNDKCDFFDSSQPSNLKKFIRHVQFVRRFDQLLDRKVSIPSTLVKNEPNLRLKVIQKILYRLGFPSDKFNAYEETIHNLIERRNDFAHGVPKEGIDARQYIEFEEIIYNIMSELMISLTQSIERGLYLKDANSNDITVITSE